MSTSPKQTNLGWTIVGGADPCVDCGDAIGCSHRIIVKEVTPKHSTDELSREVQCICRRQVKEVVTPSDVIKVLESDFNERKVEDSFLTRRFALYLYNGGRCENARGWTL